MTIKNTILIVLLVGFSAFAKAQLSSFSTSTKAVLNTYVTNGQVDYAAIKKNPKDLQVALESLKKIDIEKLSNDECKALLINAYNLFVIKGVVDVYPVKSVMDQKDFFDVKAFDLGTQKVSLNQLEKEILFKRFPDERLHFALVCGAISCPPLTAKPFTAENVDFMLKKLTKAAINNPAIVQLDMHEKKAMVSKIFDWYNADFTKKENLSAYINRYGENTIPAGFKIGYMNYDWSLNGK
ncbi:DUF547 domain-containing protein [Nonlabens antarcticus]|uniref:DUF547 domain-containing protein n=1 Tax=Nonlabens antarcticus TaxID=392714 RepID=UPI00189175F7|nr:DUF547 domain-containing protein [Nonlabens antarcticus]